MMLLYVKSGEILAFDSEEFSIHTQFNEASKNMHQEDNVIHVPKTKAS